MSTAAELCASTLYQHLTCGEVDVGAVIKALPNVSAKQQKRLRGHVDKKQTQDFCRSFVEICGDSANALTCVDALQFCYATHGAKFTLADAEWLTTTQLLFDGLDVNNRSMLSIDELILLCSLLLKAYQSNNSDLLTVDARQRIASWLSSIHSSELLPFCHFIRDQMIQSQPTKLGEPSKYYVSLLQFRTFFYQLQFSSPNQNVSVAVVDDAPNNKPTKSKAAMFLSLDSDSDDLPDFDSDSDFELPMSSSSSSKPAKLSQPEPKKSPPQPQASTQSTDTPAVLGGWDASVLLRITVALQTIWSNFGGGLDLWSSCVFSQMTDSLPTIAAQHRSIFAAMFQFLLQQTQSTRSDLISDPQFSESLLSQKLYSVFSASNQKVKLPAIELQPAITLLAQSYFARIQALLVTCDEFLHGKPAVTETISRVDVIPTAVDQSSKPSTVDVPTPSTAQQKSAQSTSVESTHIPQEHLPSIQVTSTVAPVASAVNTDSKIAVIDLLSLVPKQTTQSTAVVSQPPEHIESPPVVAAVSCDLCDSDDEADENHVQPMEDTATLASVPVDMAPIQSFAQPLPAVQAIEKPNPYSGISVQVPSNNILPVPIASASSASSPNAKVERPIKSKQVVRGVTTRPQRLSMPEHSVPTTAVELLHANSFTPVISEPQTVSVVRSASPVPVPSSDVKPIEPETGVDNDPSIADAPQSMISASDLVELEKNALEWENRAIELARAANLAASAASTLPSSSVTSASSPVSKQFNPASESSNLAVLSPVLAASTAPPQSWINYLTTVQTASDELRRVSAVVQQLVTQMQHLQHSQSQASQNFFSPLPAALNLQKPTEVPKTIEQNRTMADAVFMTPQPYVNTTVYNTTLRAPLSPSLALFESPVSPILADVRSQSNEPPISPSLQSSNQISPPQLKETTRPSSPLFSASAQSLTVTRSAPSPPAASFVVRAPTPVSGLLVLAAPALTPARYGLAVNKLNVSTVAEPAVTTPPVASTPSNSVAQNSNVSIQDLALLLSQQNALLQKLLSQNIETTLPIASSQPPAVVPPTPASSVTTIPAQTVQESKPIVAPLLTVESTPTAPPAESPVHNISSLSISTPPPQPSVSSPAVAAMLEVMVSPPHRQALMDLLLEMSGLDQKANQPLSTRSPPQLVPTPHMNNHIRSPRLHTPAYAQSIPTPFMSSLPPTHNVSEAQSSGPSSTLAQLTAAVFPVFQQSLSPRQFVDQPKMSAPLITPTPQYSYASPWQSQALNSSLHASEDEYHSLMGQSNEYENYNLSTSGHMTSNQPRNVRPSASFASRVSRFGPDTHKTQPVKQPTALAGGLRERMLREQQLKEEREQRRRDAAIAADAQSFVRLSQSAAYSTYAYPSRARRPTGQAAIQSAGAVTTEKKSSSAPVASSSVVSLNEIKTASSASGNTSSAKQIAGNDAQPEVKPASRSTQPSASHSTFVRSLRTPSPTRASPSAPSAVNSVPASSLNVPSSQQKQLQYLSKLQKAAASLLGPAHVEWMTKPIVQNVKPARPSSAAARMKF